MKKTNSANPAASNLRVLEKKWGPNLIRSGWLGFPSVILKRQKDLGIDSIDLNIILQIADHWWQHDNPPFPGKQTIADRIGVKARTVQRRIAKLEGDRLIEREYRKNADKSNKTNIYRLTGLINAAEPYAVEELEERTKKKEAKARRDKVRRLRVVPK